MKQKRLFLDKETFFHNSQIIFDKVIHHPIYKKSKNIGIYVSMNNEVDTLKLIEHMLADGKYVVVPDRKEAIKFCMENAEAGDLIVLAGTCYEEIH